MQRFLKEWGTLLLVGWSGILLVQALELPFHLEFYKYQTLFLPLFLFSSAVFWIVVAPLISAGFALLSLAAWPARWLSERRLVVAFLLMIVFLGKFQQWAIEQAFLIVAPFYFLILLILLIVVFGLTFTRSGRLILLLLAPLTLLTLSAWRYVNFWTPTWTERSEGPNVLLVIADTLRRDHTSMYGYERDTTPYLKSMADQGLVFDNVLAASAWTKPSMAALLTSRYLENDRILIGPLPVSWSGIRLPEFFHKVGYDTALLTANPNTGSYFEATRGYQWIQQATPPDHFALQTFVLPKLFSVYVRMKEWLRYRNIKSLLEVYQGALAFDSFVELSRFDRGQLDSTIPKSPEEMEAYRKQVSRFLNNYYLYNIRIKKMFPRWRMKWVVPYLEPLYRSILKYCFVTLEGAKGQVVDHWIRDQEISESFEDWYENVYDKQKPFFVHLQYMGPHTPYQEQPPHLLPHFDAKSPWNVENPPTQHRLPSHGAPALDEDKLQNMIANYDDAIRTTDANIQRVIDFLKERGQMDNTIVVFASDHGEAFYEHKIFGHMYSLHAEMVNVPLFIYWPKRLQAGRSKIPASLIDIFPTLAKLSGHGEWLDKAGPLEGMALLNENGAQPQGDFSKRVRYATTRMALHPKSNSKLTPEEKRQQRLKRQKQPRLREAVHRMVVQGNDKLVEELEGDERRLFLFRLDDPREIRQEVNLENKRVRELYELFREPPAEYQDINEPEVQQELKE